MIRLKRRISCACGCGGFAKFGNRFICYHGNSGREDRIKMSIKRGGKGRLIEDLVSKYCVCGCGRMTSPGKEFINGHNNWGDRNPMKNPETVKKSLETKKEMGITYDWLHGENHCMKKSEIKEKVRQKMEIYYTSKEWEKRRKEMSTDWLGEGNPTFGKKGKDHPSYGLKRNEEAKNKLSESLTNYFASDGAKEKLSKTVRDLWKDPEYVAKQMKSRGVRPNKLEKYFEDFLNDLYPNEWMYVGDGELIIGGKCPDFVNVNGQKKLIELYGDYWHRNDNSQDRIDIFKRFGYDTLILWESEFKNIDSIKNKLYKFVSC